MGRTSQSLRRRYLGSLLLLGSLPQGCSTAHISADGGQNAVTHSADVQTPKRREIRVDWVGTPPSIPPEIVHDFFVKGAK